MALGQSAEGQRAQLHCQADCEHKNARCLVLEQEGMMEVT